VKERIIQETKKETKKKIRSITIGALHATYLHIGNQTTSLLSEPRYGQPNMIVLHIGSVCPTEAWHQDICMCKARHMHELVTPQIGALLPNILFTQLVWHLKMSKFTNKINKTVKSCYKFT